METTAVKDLPPDSTSLPREVVEIDVTAGTDEAGMRLDQFLTGRIGQCSRTNAGEIIRLGQVTLNHCIKKPGYKLQPGDRVTGVIPVKRTCDSVPLLPEPIDLDILYQDASIIVVNKPPGLVVHPAPGHYNGTLAHGLSYHFPEIKASGPPGRSGIVHRIDKDTSGILIVAKTQDAFSHLTSLFKSRKIEKTYFAFVYGNPAESEGRILSSISRHNKDRKKMAVTKDPSTGRLAETAWKVEERFDGICLLRLGIKTGRTHQIRVHCQSIGHPLVGDATYGYKKPLRAFKFNQLTSAIIKTVKRQMLHASKITFSHPDTGNEISFEAPFPEDMILFHEGLKNAQKKIT